jgi:hypothetical protein
VAYSCNRCQNADGSGLSCFTVVAFDGIWFLVLNNTGHEAEAFPSDIAYLKSVQYPKEELFNAIKEGLDYAYRQGQISEALYTASCGRTSGSPGKP